MVAGEEACHLAAELASPRRSLHPGRIWVRVGHPMQPVIALPVGEKGGDDAGVHPPAAVGRVPPARCRHQPARPQAQQRPAVAFAVAELVVVKAQAVGVQPSLGGVHGRSIIWLRNLLGPARRRVPRSRRREAFRQRLCPRSSSSGSSRRSKPSRKGASRRFVAGLRRIDAVVGVRRPDIEPQSARHQDVVDLAQPLAKVAVGRRVAGVGNLDVVADDDVGPER